MNLINALEIPANINLADFSSYLTRQGVQHRITEEGLNQVIWVASEFDALSVRQAYRALQGGELQLASRDDSIPEIHFLPKLVRNLTNFPLTVTLIVINVLLFPVGMGVQSETLRPLLEQMTFLTTEELIGNVYFRTMTETLASGELWRLLTPMFLHFSIIHIVFNLLWVWEVGRRIEVRLGSFALLIVVLASSLFANTTQYVLFGPSLFGGMSGVVFGLLGFGFIWSLLRPARTIGMPNGVYLFMFIFLLIGFAGFLDSLGVGAIANGAHLGGMLGGMITAGLAALFDRRNHSSPS